jgi:hypothetical protein
VSGFFEFYFLFYRFYLDRRAIGQHFRDASHYFRRVISRADYGIRAHFKGVLQHQVKGVAPRLLAEAGEERNISAHERLESGADGTEDGAGADDNPLCHAEVLDDAIAVNLKSRRYHIVLHHIIFHDLMDIIPRPSGRSKINSGIV